MNIKYEKLEIIIANATVATTKEFQLKPSSSQRKVTGLTIKKITDGGITCDIGIRTDSKTIVDAVDSSFMQASNSDLDRQFLTTDFVVNDSGIKAIIVTNATTTSQLKYQLIARFEDNV